MNNEVLQSILKNKAITTNDHILFRTIFDVVSALFTDENHVSTLTGFYQINEQQQVWFPNIVSDSKKATSIKAGYANYLSPDWDYLYQFDATKDQTKRIALGAKFQAQAKQFIVFAKINEKTKGIGYHFIGVFVFTKFQDKTGKTMIYHKVSDRFQLNK